jgi:hypothetical protein
VLKRKLVHHQLGRERWATAAFAAWASRSVVNFIGQGLEVNMLIQQLRRVAQLVQLRFALLVGKQGGFDHRIRFSSKQPASCHQG